MVQRKQIQPAQNQQIAQVPLHWRRMVLNRSAETSPPAVQDAEIHSIINHTLYAAKAPAYIRIQEVKRKYRNTITLTTTPRCSGQMMLKYKDIIISATRKVDPGIMDLTINETWQQIKLHGVPLDRYFTRDLSGLDKLMDELEAENDRMKVPLAMRWLARPEVIYQRWIEGLINSSSVTFAVKGEEFAAKMIRDGVKVCGRWMRASLYIQAGPGALCTACSSWGHIEERSAFPGMVRCTWCSGNHRSKSHKCEVKGW